VENVFLSFTGDKFLVEASCYRRVLKNPGKHQGSYYEFAPTGASIFGHTKVKVWKGKAVAHESLAKRMFESLWSDGWRE
jgi:predicted Mrr-cat superfamily restriction endonuclease